MFCLLHFCCSNESIRLTLVPSVLNFPPFTLRLYLMKFLLAWLTEKEYASACVKWTGYMTTKTAVDLLSVFLLFHLLCSVRNKTCLSKFIAWNWFPCTCRIKCYIVSCKLIIIYSALQFYYWTSANLVCKNIVSF